LRIGVPKETKTHEYRVGLTPGGVRELCIHGHQVTVERNAASGIGISDDAYRVAGAGVVDSSGEVFAIADLIV
jgi:alanine dehydrogenase